MNEAWDKGLAVGVPMITTDEVYFRFREETFSFPTYDIHSIIHYNGCYYEADVKKLRKLVKKKG